MRGADIEQSGMFSYVSLESRVPPEHPLRRVGALLDEALESMHRDFERVYASGGRSSIAPERLVRALVLQVLYSIRSERLLVEQLDYNLLFRWFVGLSVDESVWVYQESQSVDRGGRCAQAFAAGRGSGAARGAALLGALQRRWHADRGLVGGQEHAPTRWQGRSEVVPTRRTS